VEGYRRRNPVSWILANSDVRGANSTEIPQEAGCRKATLLWLLNRRVVAFGEVGASKKNKCCQGVAWL
jgi:hypothetical protein